MDDVSIEELVKLKEDKKTIQQISTYYREKGIYITQGEIRQRLYCYYYGYKKMNLKKEKKIRKY